MLSAAEITSCLSKMASAQVLCLQVCRAGTSGLISIPCCGRWVGNFWGVNLGVVVCRDRSCPCGSLPAQAILWWFCELTDVLKRREWKLLEKSQLCHFISVLSFKKQLSGKRVISVFWIGDRGHAAPQWSLLWHVCGPQICAYAVAGNR